MIDTRSVHRHIEVDSNNVATISGTTMKVIELVTAQKAYGWSPEEIHFQHPYLSMSQIHSALSYYWDYKAEIDADIQRRFENAERLRHQARGQKNE
jgi:uncharacterized protein (DUF433 family)